MAVIGSKAFVPKDKHLGSWDPTSSQWLQEDYTFTAPLWGIKANMEHVPGSKLPKFTYPLVITEVKAGTEAHRLDLRVRDVVVALKTPAMQEFKQIEPEELLDARKNSRYVSDEIGTVLLAGGPCVIRAKREKKNQICEGCGSENIVEIRAQGDLVCEDCGLVFRDRLISMSSEWRTFQDDDSKVDPNRAGAAENPLLTSNVDAMATMIQPSGGGRSNGTDAVGSAANLSKNQFRASAQSADRALLDAFKEIDRMCERMNLNQNIVKAAQHMYKTVDDEVKKGKKALRSTEAVVASTVYIACRDEGVPRTLKELCAVTSATKKDIGKTFKQVQQLLHKTVQPMKASDIITRFCSNLGLSSTAERGAIDIAEAAGQQNITEGRVYTSIAGAAIFMACLLRQGTDDAKKTCYDISQATGAAEATIRQTFRDMHAKRLLLVPATFASRQQVEMMPDH